MARSATRSLEAGTVSYRYRRTLVHGAWHGGWCWKRVRSALLAQGHEAFTPSLTGPGDGVHVLSPHVDLHTHITDIVNLIRSEEREESFCAGGWVISGVADRVPDRIGPSYISMRSSSKTSKVFTMRFRPNSKDMQLEAARRNGEEDATTSR